MEAAVPGNARDERPAREADDTARSPAEKASRSFDGLASDPVFVIGHARSGTTWVYDILTSHPEVAGVLESWLFTRSNGVSRLFDERLWGDEGIRRQRAIMGESVGLAHLLTREEMLGEVRRLAERVLGRALEPHHRYLVEKTPTPYTDVGLVTEVFPGAKVVHVVRDGRDLAISLRAAALSWNPGWRVFGGDAHLRRLRALRRSAQSWAMTVRATRALGRRLGERHLEVRYEQLLAAPRESMRRIFEFCGIPHDPALLDEVVARTDFEQRFAGGEYEFRRRGRAGDWRARFGVLDALVYELSSRAALRELGYARGRLWWATSGLPLRGRWPRPGGKSP
jgi:Sulfotransferase family